MRGGGDPHQHTAPTSVVQGVSNSPCAILAPAVYKSLHIVLEHPVSILHTPHHHNFGLGENDNWKLGILHGYYTCIQFSF